MVVRENREEKIWREDIWIKREEGKIWKKREKEEKDEKKDR